MRQVATAIIVLACLGPLRQVAGQDTHIRGFTDVTFNASDRAGATTNFALGQFDLYITSALADKWSFLGETVFEFKQDFAVDVERLVITFRPNPHVMLAMGKHHTPLGYWNTAYHHGTLMQPTIRRPDMYLFEDDGGILPVHTTGALFAGRDLTPAHLGFDVMVGNGIGATPISDNNPGKSLTFALHSQLTTALRVGVNYYRDRLTPGTARIYGAPIDTVLPTGDTLTTTATEQMLGTFGVYLSPKIEIMAEYQHITHAPAAGGPSTGNDAAYLYAGYRIGKLVPYGRYDALLFAAADPHFVADDFHRAIVGARYDFAATAQLKVEYQRQTTDRTGSSNEVRVQVAIGF
jgi:hypothetical protein